MSISSIAATGMREAARALERSAQRVASPTVAFQEELAAAETAAAARPDRPTIPAARAHDPLPRMDLPTELVAAMQAHRAFAANLTVVRAEDEMTSTLVNMKR